MRVKLFCILFLLVTSLSSFEKNVIGISPSGNIKLEGSFYSGSDNQLEDISVEIVNLQSNELENIQIVKSKAKIELSLGLKYMIYVKKAGYTTKKILVDAREARGGAYKFEFDMELHKTDEAASTNDFRPVCVLKYNRMKQKFEYDSDYTSVAKSELEQEVYSKK